MNSSYAPSQMLRVLQRASAWLVECGYLREMQVRSGNGQTMEVVFSIASTTRKNRSSSKKTIHSSPTRSKFLLWFDSQSSEKQTAIEAKALEEAKSNSKAVFAGYRKNQKQGGKTFQGYRDVIIENFLKSRWKKRKQTA